MILSEAPDPQLHAFDVTVGRFEARTNRGIGRDIAKVPRTLKSHRRTYIVVGGEPVIAAALNIQCGQIEATRARRTKEEISNVVDHVGVDFLGLLVGEPAQERFDSAFVEDPMGGKKGIS